MFNVGEQIKVKVLKFDPNTERVSLGLKQITEDPWTYAARRYPLGTKVSGKVVSLTDYGAFVELEEGIEGLVHISEMSWTKRIKHPSKMVAVGDTVEAVVLDLDVQNKRISLGMKQVEPNPWTLLHEKYPIGSVVQGKIRNITDFGIFIGVEEGIDGLVHISDISWTHRVKHPSELFEKGQEVEARVLNIDVQNERFSLGIKQMIEDPWERIPHQFPVGFLCKGAVQKITEFGAFVELEKGIEGLVHISELSEDHINDPHEVVKEGEQVRVEVIHLDPAERRIGLSIKAVARSAEKAEIAAYMDSHKGEAATSLGDLLRKDLKLELPED